MTLLLPGDVGLSRGASLVDRCIRFAESRRYGRHSQEARWNHAFLVTDLVGGIVQAEGRGVVRGNASDYAHPDVRYLRPSYPPGGAQKAVAAMLGMVGSRYGFLTIGCEALAFLTQTRLRFGVAGEHICSGAVSRALEVGGVDMGDDAEWNSPADVLHIAIAGEWRPIPVAA